MKLKALIVHYSAALLSAAFFGAPAQAQDSWTAINSTTTAHLQGVMSHQERFLILGDSGAILHLQANESIFFQDIGQGFHLYDAVFSHGLYIAVGHGPTSSGNNGRVYTSGNGINWSQNTSQTFHLLKSVASNGSRVVAVGHLSAWVSIDGMTFTRHVLGSGGAGLLAAGQILEGVVWAQGKFAAVGRNGTVIYSSNGINWYSGSLPSGYNSTLRAVAHGNGTFVTVGEETANRDGALVSSDGMVWQRFRTGAGQELNGIVFGNGKFVAVGNYGAIFTSTSGTSWQQVQNGSTLQHLNAVAFGGRKFIAVGQNGTLIKSEVAASRFTIFKAVELVVPTSAGVTYQIQATADLSRDPVIWEDLGDPFIGNGSDLNRFISIKNSNLRFFKVVSR